MMRIWLVIGLTLPLSGLRLAADMRPEDLAFFESQVRPLLVEHCYECHSDEAGEASGDLLLDTAAAMRRGGARGAVLVPGDPANSLLLRAISYEDDDLQMPPGSRLDDAAVAVLRRWIELGAPDPRTGDVRQEISPLDRDPATHWAFVSPRSPRYPLPLSSGCADPIDALAASAARQQGLQPQPIAEREVLARRLYYDLTGLPPTIDQIRSFVESQRPDAYTRLVDQLLATPAFGERFARHWMDVSRYANTLGYATGNQSREYEGSERFRDWAIRAFATDMRYDEMIRHQLAGDRTDPGNQQGNLDAMGFLTLGRTFLNRFDTLDDQIDVVSRGLLGLTVNCARCHDHKFDPISAADYYSLVGILTSSVRPEEPASPLMLADSASPADHPILIRGQAGNRGPPAPRQFLTALRKPDEPRFQDGSGRLELAERIIDPSNPLTARVMVNRIWGHLIGRPLVDTPSDFGFRTEPPAIPEILDDLAVEFSGHWSVKRLVRRLVLSRVYRQVATADVDQLTLDPDNRYLARGNRKRRDFESLRDSLLAVSGFLDRALGGPPLEITGEHPHPRRTVYARIDRQNLPAVFRTFDFASPDTHAPERYFTTVPQQALYLMNHSQLAALARQAADQIDGAANDNPAELAAGTFRMILGRQPSAQELAEAIRFLAAPVTPVWDPRGAWSYGTAVIDPGGPPQGWQPLPTFTNDRLQAGDVFPAPAPAGHVFLSPEGGHTPASATVAVVRRLTMPRAGTVIKITGKIAHRQQQGDGVICQVWVAGRKCFERVVHHAELAFELTDLPMEPHQSIDLVAAPGPTSSYDSFQWHAEIQFRDADGQELRFDSRQDFSPSPPHAGMEPLGRLAQLAQALMMTNEFVFID